MAIGTSEPVAEYVTNTDASSYTHSSSYTPAANSVQVIFVTATGCTLASPTISGGSGWDVAPALVTSATFNSGVSTLYCFVGRAGASPGSFTCVFDCTGDAATGCMMAFVAFTGAASSSYTVQTKVKNSTASTNPSITFDASLNTNNGYAFACANPANPAGITETGSWTESVDTGHTSPTTGLFVQHRAGGESGATVTTTRAGSINHGIIGIEIAVATGAYSITADQGAFSLSGQAVALQAARNLVAAQGSFALTGQAATFLLTRKLSADYGAVTLTGQAAGLVVSRAIAAAQGSFTLTGQSAGLVASRKLTADQGSFTLSGQDATLTYTPVSGAYTLTAEAGNFALSGQDAALTYTPAPSTQDTHDGADDISESEARAYLKKRKERRAKEEAKARAAEQAARKPSATFDTPEPTEQTPNQAPLAPFDTPDYSAHLALLAEIERLNATLGALSAARFAAAEQALADEIRARAAQATATAILTLVAEHQLDEDDEEDLILLMSI